MTCVDYVLNPLAGGQIVVNSQCAFFGCEESGILLTLIAARMAYDAATAEECP